MSTETAVKFSLCPPSLVEAAAVLRSGLEGKFGRVSVSVEDCPDLTAAPFHLAGTGFGGDAKIVDVGGVGNLFPTLRKDKIYNVEQICKDIGSPGGFAIGPGAGPHHKIGVNSEGMYNCNCSGQNLSCYTKMNTETDSYESAPMPDATMEFALMANLLVSEGKPCKVLHIECEKRLGSDNFTDAVRFALLEHFGQARPIAIGGVFLIRKGKANLHVMPDFLSSEFPDLAFISDKWLRYFDMDAPLICLSVLHTADPGLGLRMEHTHCFSRHGAGGHYHDDTTPDHVHYDAFFVLPETLFRIDQC